MVRNLLGWFTLIAIVGLLVRQLEPGDGYNCKSTLEDGGVWLKPGVNRKQPPQNWQPKQCMLRTFDNSFTQKCLGNQTAIFVGDSHAREMFWAFVRSLKPSFDNSKYRKHADIEMKIDNVQLRFFWDPYFKSKGLTELTNIASGKDKFEGTKAKLLHLSLGSWHINRKDKEAGFRDFKESLRRLDEVISTHDDAGRKAFEFITLSPLFIPDYKRLKEVNDLSRITGLDAESLTRMNDYLYNHFNKNPYRETRIIVPFSFLKMRDHGGRYAFNEDGFHMHNEVYKTMADTILNVRCNQELLDNKYNTNNGPVYPFSETCCVHYKQPRTVSQILLLGLCALIPILYLGHQYSQSDLYSRYAQYVAWPVPAIHNEGLFKAAVVISGALAYSFFSDRTQFFGKGAKHFELSEFWGLMVCLIALAGYSFLTPCDSSFLNRKQTEEWKGWMQAVILVYHITGGSKVLSIYKFVRVLVSAYLFMTGYGHTTFFIKKGDFSLQRAASILFRMNFLSILLAYVMDTDYLFYYFAPLVSFWFCVVWITFRIFPSYNSIETSVAPVLAKITASALIVNLLVRFELPFKVLFLVLKTAFNIQWNLDEWRFRTLLDIFIVYFGMVFAVATLRYQQGNFPLMNVITNRLFLGIVAILLSLAYYGVAATFEVKQNYNKTHPYISWMPILAFVIIRNLTEWLRSRHSSFMAFIGACSLETFTLQFHFFLAADTKGRLYILSTPTFTGIAGDVQKYLNLLLVTVIFILVSHAVAEQSNVLTKIFVGQQDQRLPAHQHSQPLQQSEDIEMEQIPASSKTGRVSVLLANHTLKLKIAAAFLCMWALNLLS